MASTTALKQTSGPADRTCRLNENETRASSWPQRVGAAACSIHGAKTTMSPIAGASSKSAPARVRACARLRVRACMCVCARGLARVPGFMGCY